KGRCAGSPKWSAFSPAPQKTSSSFETPALLHCARRRWEEAQSRKMEKQNERNTQKTTRTAGRHCAGIKSALGNQQSLAGCGLLGRPRRGHDRSLLQVRERRCVPSDKRR